MLDIKGAFYLPLKLRVSFLIILFQFGLLVT